MVFYENGKKVRYNPYHMKKDKRIGEGDEVEVYQVGNEVVKFYKRYCKKIRLTKKECECLVPIYTERILLPTTSLLDKKHHIRGYKMTYVEDLGAESFYILNRKDLSKEMTLIHKDIIRLSDENVLIEDLNLDNTVFHNGIYFIDPGSFQIGEREENSEIKTYGINMDRMNEYLLNKIIMYCCLNLARDTLTAKRMIESIQEDIKSKNLSLLTYLIEGMEQDSILDLVISKYHATKSCDCEKMIEKQKCKKIR